MSFIRNTGDNLWVGALRRLLMPLLFLSPVFLSAQGEFNKWYFGANAGIDFNSTPPSALPASAMNTMHASVSVADSLGSLLFYSQGLSVYNRNHQIMPNGNGLLGDQLTQGVFIVMKPGADNIYYLFTINNTLFPVTYGLYYSLIDMNLNGGLGDVVSGNKNIFISGTDDVYNGIHGTRYLNNYDAWIIVRKFTTNQYAAYRITSSGISVTPVLSACSLPGCNGFSCGNNVLKISQDGTRYVFVSHDPVQNIDIAELGIFNSQTGVLFPLFQFRPFNLVHENPLYFEFSPDSKYLYAVSSFTTDNRMIFQYNLAFSDSVQFMQSQILIATPHVGLALQLGPDGKIYQCVSNLDSLNVIHNPNVQGLGCNFQSNALALASSTFCHSGLPQFLQRYKSYLHFSGNCLHDSLHFSGDIWPPGDTIRWNFGDPASGVANVSYLPTPSHLFTAPGNYTVELYVRHNDNRTDTTWRTITIYPSPAPLLGPDKTICAGGSTTFDAGFCSICSYEWKNLGTGLIVGTDQTFATGIAGNYSVKVTNGNNCAGYDTVQLVTTPVPQVTNTQLTKSICSGENVNISLSPSVPGTMFHWTASLVSGNITGFSADSGLVINQVLVDNLPTAGVVAYSVTPKVGSCSGNAVDFTVTVNPGDSAKVSVSASANNICSGTPVTFTAVPTNPGTAPVYQWKVNGVGTGSNSPVLAYAPANGDQVQCILTSSMTVCISNNPAASNIIVMTVNPLLPVSVAISASANNVCSGTTVVFTAASVNGGSTPSYQWKVNGIPAGSNSSVYSYVPANNDAVSCTLSSSETCATGNPATSPAVIMTVNPQLPASVSIAASSNPFCIGTSVAFSAAAVNGGPLAAYQWKVNGTNAGANSSTYAYNPVTGDIVTCILTSSLQCVSGSPASSNSIVMTGTPGLPASVAIAANPNPFCPGSPVAFTAAPGNGGAAPAFQWKVNGANAGSNAPTFVYNPSDQDSVRCVMTSNLTCVSSNPAISNKIVLSGSLAPPVSFSACFDTLTTVNAKPFKLKGGLPLGGAWSGPGVNALTGTFDPVAAGTGLKTIAYSYTNVYLCSASKTKTIAVQPASPFTCGNTLTDIRDGKTYPTVQIGSQCWMAANLNRGTQVVSTLVQMDNCTDEKYCFGNDPAKCSKYGGLYQWDEMMRYDDAPAGQGICPPSWHIPTDNDWTTLCNFYNGFGFAGKPLQDSVISGFRALTGGVFYLNSSWSFADFAVLFWTSTPWGASKALSHGLNIYNFSVSLYPASRANAFPIRCLKD
jgi:uncharacterized protein (TIGR02145 family)